MFPLLAIGAIAAGVGATIAAASSNESSGASASSRRTQAKAEPQTVSPQSFIVTPIQGGSQASSLADAIGKFTV